MPTQRDHHQQKHAPVGITPRSGYSEESRGLLRPGVRVELKYQLMWQEKANFPITMMARLMGVARSGYYKWVKQTGGDLTRKARSVRARERVWITKLILQDFRSAKMRHGARRVRAQLAKLGVGVSLWLVRKIMAELGLVAVQPRASKRTTIPATDAGTRRDLVRRRFYPPVPGTFLVGDITYLKTGEGWVYLATVIDLTTRMVIGWHMADHMRTSLVADALTMACHSGLVAGGAVFHSDRGSVYTSAEHARLVNTFDVRLSIGRTGVWWDNAVAEAFFASLKNEMFHLAKWPTKAKARVRVAEYIEVYYNRSRPHSTLAYRTPAEAWNDHFTHTLPTELPLAA
ncbi:MAG: IS3 family transposase [Bifidobacteriaceae bacterium]|jgi:transposase InsO family protein|nr:IS3 family transposase [Bifidobacteriaceae bacterium]